MALSLSLPAHVSTLRQWSKAPELEICTHTALVPTASSSLNNHLQTPPPRPEECDRLTSLGGTKDDLYSDVLGH